MSLDTMQLWPFRYTLRCQKRCDLDENQGTLPEFSKEQRNQEVVDLKTHLKTAEAFKNLVQDTKRKRPDQSDYQESIKRVRSFPYRAAQYSFNNFDDDF